VNAELLLKRSQPALQGADHTRRDTGGMPVHAHHGAERLEPERVGETPQQFVATVMMNDRFADNRTKVGHPVGKPSGNLPGVQRQVCGSSSLSHSSSVS
jgi:hypothetical protein